MRINYTIKGSGIPVILLHGWGGSSSSLNKLQEELVVNFEVYNLDLPGFGESDTPLKTWFLGDYVNWLHGFIKENKIGKPILVGHSFGGKLAMAHAEKHQNDLSAIVLINASGIKPKSNAKKGLLYLPAKIGGAIFKLPVLRYFKKTVKKIFYKLIVRESDYIDAGVLKETFKNIINEHLDTRIRKITIPTLIVWGEKDSYTPLWMGRKITEMIKGSRLEVVAGASHDLPIKQSEMAVKIIFSFFQK